MLNQQKRTSLTLNHKNSIDQTIENKILSDQKDLLLIFKPTDLFFYEGALQKATYEIVGVDTQTKKEIWKANFSSASSFGPALFAEKSVQKIYNKLITDQILQ
ncbi:hypothetical protein [uncultured Aquimarina sp.]|uniref:hypothetical protein n=1 Tax=uncultured Aquimarina sp. TaxID=575652 RepID=UPI00260E906B|nr:hypothetical protein [uncultured Aquimarina sp.]